MLDAIWTLSVQPFLAEQLSVASGDTGTIDDSALLPQYAALVCSVGYESRGSFIPLRLWQMCGQVWGYGFDAHHVYSFEENRNWMKSHGTYFDEPEAAYRKHLVDQVKQLAVSWKELTKSAAEGVLPLRLAVDISSMSRDRMAQTVLALIDDSDEEMQIDWLYAPARFSEDELAEEGPVSVNRALGGFEGWTNDPAKPAVCVVGTGIEGDLALGAVEKLEPAQLWVLAPKGYDPEYDTEFDSRNRQMLASVSASHLIKYAVDQPFSTLLQLDALISQLRSDYRVVIVPLGPKIFALEALLLGRVFGDITVWRLSADFNRLPRERVATGTILGLRSVTKT